MSISSPAPVFQVVYHSLATYPLPTSADHTRLLALSRVNNQARGISGMLLYAETTGEYLQVLEGPEEEVRALYRKISVDVRHYSVYALSEGPAAERCFPNWQMGFAPLEADALAQLAGYLNPRKVLNPATGGSALLEILADFARTRDVSY